MQKYLFRHSFEGGNCLNPDIGGTGFRIAPVWPGMTTSSYFQEFCKRLGRLTKGLLRKHYFKNRK